MIENRPGEEGLGANGDAFYELLMAAHQDLETAQSTALNARLVLMMANEIGDIDKLGSIIAEALKIKD